MAAFEKVPGDERLTSAILSDSLDAAGLRSPVLESRLAPVVAGSRAFGRAATARFAPSEEDDGDDPYRAAIDFVDDLARGELVVFATGEANASAAARALALVRSSILARTLDNAVLDRIERLPKTHLAETIA